ncbi:aldehyde dehydrogenase [Reticulomyxa filosa]|uniref:Aldehyde dehydrogenase n=1 Tax=Reticulomyxa filosa TaxID=46433 RepID=X6MZD7_RETFI|nr:aldehyde dehydrogenase [Reticulomyxa filosa]|eukprot:ETO19196.1 aldehyde dehydrogenase [Reticulomyxa filosa]
MLPRKLEKSFIEEAKKAIEEFFGTNPQTSKDYGRIVSENHFNRLSGILKDNEQKIVYGGHTNATERYISPTILGNITPKDPVMKEEVFGPILTVIPVDNVKKDCISYIQNREKPLSLYVFSRDSLFVSEIVSNTDSGGVTVNDVVMHLHVIHGFPFGGTGASGVGSYHGPYSFAAFSHEKPVLHKYHGAEFINKARYPPYTERKTQIMRSLTEEKIYWWSKYLTPFTVAGGLGAMAFVLQSRFNKIFSAIFQICNNKTSQIQTIVVGRFDLLLLIKEQNF